MTYQPITSLTGETEPPPAVEADPREILTLVEMMPRERYALRPPREWRRYFLTRFYAQAVERHWAAPVTVPTYTATLKRLDIFGAQGAPVEVYEIRVQARSLPMDEDQ